MDGKARYLDNPRAFLRTNGRTALDMSRLWRSLKYECVYLHAWETGSQAKAGVGRWITFYNHLRPHAAHGGQPPALVYFNATPTHQQVQAVVSIVSKRFLASIFGYRAKARWLGRSAFA